MSAAQTPPPLACENFHIHKAYRFRDAIYCASCLRTIVSHHYHCCICPICQSSITTDEYLQIMEDTFGPIAEPITESTLALLHRNVYCGKCQKPI